MAPLPPPLHRPWPRPSVRARAPLRHSPLQHRLQPARPAQPRGGRRARLQAQQRGAQAPQVEPHGRQQAARHARLADRLARLQHLARRPAAPARARASARSRRGARAPACAAPGGGGWACSRAVLAWWPGAATAHLAGTGGAATEGGREGLRLPRAQLRAGAQPLEKAPSSCGTSRLLGKSAAPRHDSSRTFIALPAPGAGGGRLHDLAGVPGGAARRRGPQPAQLQPARAAAAWAGALAAGADGARHGGRAPARGRLPGGARQRGGGRGGQGGDVHLPGRGARPPPAPPARSLVFATSRRRAVPAPARSPRRRRPGGQ